MFLDDPGAAVASPPVREQRSRPLSDRPPDDRVIGWILLGVIVVVSGLVHAVDVGLAAERRHAGVLVSKQADESRIIVRCGDEYHALAVDGTTYRALQVGDAVEVTQKRTIYSRRISVECVRKTE